MDMRESEEGRMAHGAAAEWARWLLILLDPNAGVNNFVMSRFLRSQHCLAYEMRVALSEENDSSKTESVSAAQSFLSNILVGTRLITDAVVAEWKSQCSYAGGLDSSSQILLILLDPISGTLNAAHCGYIHTYVSLALSSLLYTLSTLRHFAAQSACQETAASSVRATMIISRR